MLKIKSNPNQLPLPKNRDSNALFTAS